MEIEINKALCGNKNDLLEYFRDRTTESLQNIKEIYGESQYRKRATAINKTVIETKNQLISTLFQKARKESWDNHDILKSMLIATYTSYVTMLEFRNAVWPYEYMTFSRRIGELWEPFCKLCFEYPLSDISLYIPPLFADVKKAMADEISDYIQSLNLTEEQKAELLRYYGKVWSLVTSGEIKLELDCHFQDASFRYNVDFKSGFGSNEKGNTNRLLLVASIYENLESNYKCVLLVRSEEDLNNHYFQTLKDSRIWEAYCGIDSYNKIKDYTGFDIHDWIEKNICWADDLSVDFYDYLRRNDMEKYLIW